jgi:hypothetical protein
MPKWFEVFAENGLDPPYVLVLVGDESADPPTFKIYDPKGNDRLIETFTDYGEARNWLSEDAYTLVSGREDMMY